MTRTTSRFGVEYDSLADLVAFGVAPAILAFSWALQPWGRLGWLAAFLYVACGALRLARFNVQVDTAEPRVFRGLPIPMAAGLIASTYLLFHAPGDRSRDQTYLPAPHDLCACPAHGKQDPVSQFQDGGYIQAETLQHPRRHGCYPRRRSGKARDYALWPVCLLSRARSGEWRARVVCKTGQRGPSEKGTPLNRDNGEIGWLVYYGGFFLQ